MVRIVGEDGDRAEPALRDTRHLHQRVARPVNEGVHGVLKRPRARRQYPAPRSTRGSVREAQ